MQPRMLLTLMPGYKPGSCLACCPPGPTGPFQQSCSQTHQALACVSASNSSFPGTELVFALAGSHEVSVWVPPNSSPAFKHVNCSLSLVSSANLMRSSTSSRHQGQVMALDKLFSLVKNLYLSSSLSTLIHSLPSSTSQCGSNLHHPTALYHTQEIL